MKKYIKSVHTLFSKQPSQYAALFFAIFFGLMMLAIGLSQLFAQSTVAFVLQPYSQSANSNENKSLTINLTTGGQQVDGGNVRVTYDSAQLSYVTFNDLGAPSVSISNKVSAPGSYSFDFQIFSGSQNSPNLATLTLKTNAVNTTQPAIIKFDAANTYAYQGFNTTSRTFYPSAYGQAAIVLSASQSQPTSTPTPTPTTSPKPNSAAPNPTQPLATQTAPTPTAQQATPPSNGESVILSSAAGKPATKASKSKKIAPIAFISIGLVLLVAGVGMLIYKKYVRELPLGLSLRSLHTGLFDDTPKISDEEVVVAPAEATVLAPTPDKPQVAQQSKPQHQIITKSKNTGLHHLLLPSSPKKATPDHPPLKDLAAKTTPAPVLAPKSAEKPKAPPAEHKPETKAESITKTNPPVTHAHPMKTIMPLRPPQAPPPLVPILPQAPQAPAKPVKNTASVPPSQHMPDWQSQLKVSHAAPKDNPPDMFELAKEHPESYGSSQLYDVETKEKENGNPDKKQ